MNFVDILYCFPYLLVAESRSLPLVLPFIFVALNWDVGFILFSLLILVGPGTTQFHIVPLHFSANPY